MKKVSQGDNMADPKTAAFMDRAIALAYEGMAGHHGGPFGAVIVKDGKVIGEGHNRVLSGMDPTAHAEVTAIRDACANTKHFDLSGAEIFVNAMPCPMCMSAIFWARISKVYYGCTPADAEKIGFDDAAFYRELEKPPEERSVPAIQVIESHEAALACFQAWADNDAKTHY
jgi:tRNA(Arg) A34 adenosine deaminase TadA